MKSKKGEIKEVKQVLSVDFGKISVQMASDGGTTWTQL